MRLLFQGVALVLLFSLLITGCELAGEGETRYITAEEPFYVGEWKSTSIINNGSTEITRFLRFKRELCEYIQTTYSDSYQYSNEYLGYVSSTDTSVTFNVELINWGNGWMTLNELYNYLEERNITSTFSETWTFSLSSGGDTLVYDNGDGTTNEYTKTLE